MAGSMRYWISSIAGSGQAPRRAAARRESMDRSKPARTARGETTVAGSWHWSPTRSSRPLAARFWRQASVSASTDCAASSTTATSKAPLRRTSDDPHVPSVAKTTRDPSTNSRARSAPRARRTASSGASFAAHHRGAMPLSQLCNSSPARTRAANASPTV